MRQFLCAVIVVLDCNLQVAPAVFESPREDVIVHQPAQPTRDTAVAADSTLEDRAGKVGQKWLAIVLVGIIIILVIRQQCAA